MKRPEVSAPTGLLEPETPREARVLFDALSDFMRVQQFRDRDCVCCYDVSVTQCHALRVLAPRPHSINDLAARLYLDKSTTSRVVDTLQRKGYVRKGCDPDDRRAVLVLATPRGTRLAQRIEHDLFERHAQVLDGVPADVRRAAVDLVVKLLAASREGVSVSGGKCCVVDETDADHCGAAGESCC
jgi:DNA-binding MarR family transcriptional regulator